MSPLSMARKLAAVANALFRVVSEGLEICPISGCSFMPNFPNFLFTTMLSVLSRTSSLVSLDMEVLNDVKLDALVSRMIAPACFRSASKDIPTPSGQQSFLLSIFTSFDIPGSSPKYCSVDFQLRLQLVSHSKQDPLVLLTQRTRLHAQDISNFSGDDRTERVKPYHLRNRVWPSFLELTFANFDGRPWSHTCSCVALHTCCCPRLSSSSLGAPRIPRVALERRRSLERRRTPSMLSFWDHSWCVKSAPGVLQWTELHQTTLRCLIL